MKAFVSGVALIVVIALIAWVGLDSVGMSASDVFTSDRSVRL